MPERDALTCDLGDGYVLIAAGVRRERSGDLAADLILKNGTISAGDRAVLNTEEGRARAAAKLAASMPEGPEAEQLAAAILDPLLPEALAALQDDTKKPTQADLLVGLVAGTGDFAGDVAAEVDLFHDPGGVAYATFPVADHRETWPLRSRGFREWLARRYHAQYEKTPGGQALVDAVNVLSGKALFDGPERRVQLRLAEHWGTVYLDLGNERWNAVAIDATGWRIVANPPVRFRRSRGMLPLPTPVAGGAIGDLRRFLNLPRPADDAAWTLVVAWLVAALRPRGPYPILVDPNKSPARSLSRDDRDLMISATNGWLLVFDNLSKLADWQSDALCRLSTGGGLATRELYTDLDETILDAVRPMILNGIEEIATRNDLLDRAIVIWLPTIPKERRRPEKHLQREFEQARPAILGGLLDAVVEGLRNEGTVALAEHPRMADFAEWAVAAEPALPWSPGAFLAAYFGNRDDANDLTLDASPVAGAVRAFAERRAPWTGTATELLTELEAIADEKVRRQKAWPESPRTLANTLRRLAPNLRAAGVDLAFDRSGRRRTIMVEREASPPSPPSLPSPSASASEDRGDGGSGGDAEDRHRAAPPSPPSSSPRSQVPMKGCGSIDAGDAGDDGDDGAPERSPVGSTAIERECVHCGETLPPGSGSRYCAKHGGRAATPNGDNPGEDRCYACGATRDPREAVCPTCHPPAGQPRSGLAHGAGEGGYGP